MSLWVANPLAIALIAIPLILQTYLILWISAQWMRFWRQPQTIAAPGTMIGASNFFELAVAVAISLFGLNFGAALATVVGVLVEVPVMPPWWQLPTATAGCFRFALPLKPARYLRRQGASLWTLHGSLESKPKALTDP